MFKEGKSSIDAILRRREMYKTWTEQKWHLYKKARQRIRKRNYEANSPGMTVESKSEVVADDTDRPDRDLRGRVGSGA